MKRLLTLLFASTLPWAAIGADPANDERPINIRIEMQVVAIPAEVAVPLVGDLMKKDKIEAANAKIQDLLTKGTAKLIGWPIVVTKSGQRAVVEAIDELRYGTEYDPPTVSFTPGVDTTQPVKIEPKADVAHLEGVPSAFETRNVGVTLEVEPVLSKDGKTIDINVVPQHVRLKGYTKVTIEKPSGGGKVSVDQPEFDVMKVTTSLTLRSGERILMGVYRTDDPPKHIEFFILKAEAIPVE